MANWQGYVAGLLALSAPLVSHAAEQALGYDLVVHVSDLQALPVPGRAGHEVGIAAFEGIAIFDDGRIANHRYAGSFDFIDGEGSFRGYALWAFQDGSRLTSSYEGRAEASDDGITLEGRHSDLAGTGNFTGARIDHLDSGGDTHHRGVLTLTLPE